MGTHTQAGLAAVTSVQPPEAERRSHDCLGETERQKPTGGNKRVSLIPAVGDGV